MCMVTDSQTPNLDKYTCKPMIMMNGHLLCMHAATLEQVHDAVKIYIYVPIAIACH